MIQNLLKTTFGLIGMLAVLLTGCDKTQHETQELPEGRTSGITIGLNTSEVTVKPLGDIHLFFFDVSDKLVKHEYYANMHDLALSRTWLEEGHYTIFAILNTDAALMPSPRMAANAELPDISFFDFKYWVYSLPAEYPNLLTGLVRCEVEKGVKLIMIDLKDGSGAADIAVVTLNLTFPSPLLPDFIPLRSAGAERLRTVAEVYEKGTENRFLRKEAFVAPTSTEGVYQLELVLPSGEYDLRLWSDYASDEKVDNHYLTTNMQMVKILGKDLYTANTDARDAFTQTAGLTVANIDLSKDITMLRPLAKYRLVATDVKQFKNLAAKYGFPPIEDIAIDVRYDGFLPTSYNTVTKKPNGSEQNYAYVSVLADVTDTEAQVGKDFIFVNGDQSQVEITILIKNKNTGKTISKVSGVKVNYRAGYLTTVRGDFLTGGATGGDINIDTEWDEDFTVEF